MYRLALIIALATTGCKKSSTTPSGNICDGRVDAFGPVNVADPDLLHRPTPGRVDQLETTPKAPIELCGVAMQLDFLSELTCPDGSKAFASRAEAHAARAFSLGGGPCGTMVDQYIVPCGETRHDVFLDLYMCSRAESML